MTKINFPLSTLDPTAPLDDLAPLAALIGDDVRIVAIGESAHAAHEFYTLRHRLIRFLIERLNFTAVVWESGFPEAFKVDDYIRGGSQNREAVQIEGMTMNFGRCQEMGALLDWLRQHNVGALSPVRFYGLDLPDASTTLVPALALVGAYVEKVDPGFSARLPRLQTLAAASAPEPIALDPDKIAFAGSEAIQKYMALPAADRNELTALLADLSARFDSLPRTYIERSDAERYDFARQHLRVASQLDVQLRAVAALMSGDAAACEGNIRDRTMADTADWILGRHARIIIAAHNGHIQKTPIATPTGTTASVDTVGVHLAMRHGPRYLAIGTTCGGGEMIAMRSVPGADGSYDSELYIRDLPPADAETIDGVLDANLSQLSLLDLRTLDSQTASQIDATRRMRMQDQAPDINVRQAFDMLVHVPRITCWTSSTNATLPDERITIA